MRSLDWESRHKLMESLRLNGSKHYEPICSMMSPDELLQGRNTGVPVLPNSPIIVKDSSPTVRQTKIEEYFVRSVT